MALSDGRKPNPLPYTKSLFLGLRGEEVSRLQEWLNDLNNFYRFYNKIITENGYFGFSTLNCVRAFQRFYELDPSGVYNAATHDMVEWKYFNMKEIYRIKMGFQVTKEFQKPALKPISKPVHPTQKKAAVKK